MYQPPYATKLTESKHSPFRIAIQGAPHTGKTWAALTFPNPVVLDLDNKLGAHIHREDILRVSFFDNDTVQKFATEYGLPFQAGKPPVINRFVVFMSWVAKEISKFSPEQTLIIDSWTMLQNNFDAWAEATPVMSKEKGEVDRFEFWGRKQKYSRQLLEMLKTTPAGLVVNFHESKDMNSEGIPTGKLNPLMTGAMKEQLGQHFTDWYRQTAEAELDANKKPTGRTGYYWQIKPNEICNCCCSVKHLIDNPSITKVPATYASLVKAA